MRNHRTAGTVRLTRCLASRLTGCLAGCLTVCLALTLPGCRRGDTADQSVTRGRGLPVASLPVATRADIYAATLRAAFDVGPSLVLLLHPQLLPRTAGLAGGQPVPAELESALRRTGTAQGTCRPPTAQEGRAPQCEARAPGYVVRFSDVLQLPADSVQVYLEAERYATPASGPAQAFRFEKAYQLVRRGDSWRVAREGRVPDSK